jgi:bacteriocin-like protein
MKKMNKKELSNVNGGWTIGFSSGQHYYYFGFEGGKFGFGKM